jgi:hypothetical protein
VSLPLTEFFKRLFIYLSLRPFGEKYHKSSFGINMILRTTILIFFFLIILLTQSACPDNPKETECGENQVEVNGTCECADGYHWNDDQTQCKLDTTSHNFVWEIDTLGDYGSYLNDVAIIDENNVWVVGQIIVDDPDSSFNGTGREKFNAAHWDGSEWELIRIAPTPYLYGVYYSVYAFNTNDVWFGGSIVVHFNGNKFTPYGSLEGFPGGFYVNKVWGTSSSDLYFVGGNGNIVHYDGSDFRRMESGTETGIINIWGLDGQHIWAVTYQNNANGIINEVLFYNGNEWTTKFNKSEDNWPPVDYTKPSGTFRSVWVYGDTVYISCASLYKESIKTGEGILVPLEEMHWQLGWGTGNVRGRNYNDIVVTTSFGSEVSHFNGKNWKFYEELDAFDIYDRITSYGLAMKNDLIVIVGEDITTGKAVVYRGYR